MICFLPHELMAALNFSEAIVFQPEMKWEDGSKTRQGTGSFVKTPNGKLVGMTSAHFIDFSGPKLLEVDWLDIKTEKPIAISVKSWGVPGREGSYDPLDLRSDYLLLLMEGDIASKTILEIDSRTSIAVGERVWFPNKNAKAKAGYDLIEGKVTKANEAYLLVKLEKEVDLQSRSGTPIISQSTEKVIGILTGCEDAELYLAPGHSIYSALLKTQQPLWLKDVVGLQD
jgi:hypothetical protein